MAPPKNKITMEQLARLLEIESARWAKPAVDEDVGKAVLSDEMADMGVKPSSQKATVAKRIPARVGDPTLAAYLENDQIRKQKAGRRLVEEGQPYSGVLEHEKPHGAVAEPALFGMSAGKHGFASSSGGHNGLARNSEAFSRLMKSGGWSSPEKLQEGIRGGAASNERSYWRAVEDPDILPMSQGAPAHISAPVETEETPLRQQLRLMARGVDAKFPKPSASNVLIQGLARAMGVTPEKLQSMLEQIRKRGSSVEQELDAQLDPLNFGGNSNFKRRR